MTTLPGPPPPNNICVQCLENIIPGENDCAKNPTGRHLPWHGDNTGLLAHIIGGQDNG